MTPSLVSFNPEIILFLFWPEWEESLIFYSLGKSSYCHTSLLPNRSLISGVNSARDERLPQGVHGCPSWSQHGGGGKAEPSSLLCPPLCPPPPPGRAALCCTDSRTSLRATGRQQAARVLCHCLAAHIKMMLSSDTLINGLNATPSSQKGKQGRGWFLISLTILFLFPTSHVLVWFSPHYWDLVADTGLKVI